MAKYKMLSFTTPLPGREDEFHDWYQNVHLPEVVAFPGVTGAQRYKVLADLMGKAANPFLAIYDIECDDPMVFLGAMGEASATGKMTQSDTPDMSTNYTALFSEYGERVFPKG